METTPQLQDAAKARALEAFRERFGLLKTEIGRLMVGQEDLIDFTLMAIVGGGHVLIEGLPGLGKTLLVKSIGEALRLSFKRVQFTPDTRPRYRTHRRCHVDVTAGGGATCP